MTWRRTVPGVRRTPDHEVVWNRAHPHLVSDPVGDQAKEITRLEGLSATRTDAALCT
ncbi:hypothetical protein ACIGW1_12685 [Streptomyces sp. NPDC053780]|uniref:hypothetical protein n=1 Tax=unclassified Streptomyces TaxID=2593676 RepID=UPI003418D6A6